MQVVNVSNNHWLAFSTIGCKWSTIKIFDSLHIRGLPKRTQKLVAALMQCMLEFVDVQGQRGSNDCGLFALAFVTSVCFGIDPASQIFDQKAMHRHLLDCIEEEEMRPFHSMHGRKPKPLNTESLKVFCSCRLPYHEEMVVEC